MKPHVKLAKNEQVWHGVSSSYFSLKSATIIQYTIKGRFMSR